MTASNPVRVLHVVGSMTRGGIETWLMHVLRRVDRQRIEMDFVVHTDVTAAYDEEVLSLGSRIIPCLHPSNPVRYARNFRRILRESGPYDVVHSHVDHFNGYVLRLAHSAGVPSRIAHSHNDTSSLQVRAGTRRRLYLSTMKRWIRRHATVGLAASRKAAESLFGPEWDGDPRWRLLYYGIDLSPFRIHEDRTGVRRPLGIPDDAIVIGHAGRFVRQKNHRFLVEIAAEVGRREPGMRLLLIGDGSLRPAVEKMVAEAGLRERTLFAGVREDVPRLMLGAMDVFLMPSLHEGLPLVLIEAQAAGLPIVMSSVIPGEAAVVSKLVTRLSLEADAATWADAILASVDGGRLNGRSDALLQVENSGFGIGSSIADLQRIYEAR